MTTTLSQQSQQQVLSEYIEARQHKQQQWAQQGSQHRTDPLAEKQEEEV